MNYNDELKRIKLFMNYDSRKTLNENEEKLKPILLEYKKGSKTLGDWCATTDYNLGSSGYDYTLKKGSCFKAKSDAGPNAWAYCSADPFESDDPLVFDCGKKSGSYLWEPDGYGEFWDQGLDWKNAKKKYYNNQLEDSLKTHFCTVPKEGFADSKYWNTLIEQLKAYGFKNLQTSGDIAYIGRFVFYKNAGDKIASYKFKDNKETVAKANSPYAGESLGDFLVTGTGGKTLRSWLDTYVKKYKEEYGTDLTATTKTNVGGGGTIPGVASSNMANNELKYWTTLYKTLESAGYNVRTKGSSVEDASKFYIDNFTISRDTEPFICLDCPSPTPSISQLSQSGYTFGQLDKDNATPKKYSGESDLNKVRLLVQNVEGRDFLNLLDFLALGSTKSGVKDKTGGKKTGTGTGTGTGKKTGTGTGTGTGTAFSWKSCSGTYSYGCKSPEVGQAQKCMGIKIDDKFGSGTLRTLRARFGRTSFTDDYLKNVICAKQGSGSSNTGYEFDQESSTTQSGSDSGPSTFTGTVY